LGIFLASLPAHLCAVCHELSLVLLELSVLDEAFMLSNASLLDAAEDEDTGSNGENTADRSDDGDLGT
jgi:hypothetical protein